MDNKEKILESALDLFYSKGYDAVGVQEIVERSGITKPTLYHYFGSKYGLLEHLVRNYYGKFEEKLEGLCLRRRSAADIIPICKYLFQRGAEK